MRGRARGRGRYGVSLDVTSVRTTGDLLALDFSVYGSPPTLDSYVRSGTVWCPAKYESGFGERVESFGANVLPQMYHPALVTWGVTSGIGFAYEDAQTNLIASGVDRDLSTWSVSNVTHAANAVDAPDVEETASNDSDTFTATANNGYAAIGVTTVATTEYSYQAMIRRTAGGSPVTGRLIAYDVTGAAEDGAAAFSVTNEWERVTLTRVAAGSTSTELRIEIDTSGDAVAVDFACVMAGGDGSFVPGAGTRPVPSSAYMTNTGGNTILLSAAGEIRMVVLPFSPAAGGSRHLFDTFTTLDRREVFLDNGTKFRGVARNSAAGVESSAAFATDITAAGHDVRMRWDADAPISGYAQHHDIWQDGVREAGSDVDGWTYGDASTQLYIGHARVAGTTTPLQGLISYLDIFSTPQADPS